MEMISNSLCDRLFSEFTNEDEQVFLQHFRMYLDYNDDNDYVIDLDKVLKFLGFANKGNAKKVLLKHFIQDKHYLLLPVEKQDSAQHGGNNKIQILMTPATFKDLCLRAETSRASQIRSYYLKMERIVMKHLEDTLTTTYQQLYTAQQKVKALENEMANSKKKQTKKYEVGDAVYIAKDCALANVYKIGCTDNANIREPCYFTHGNHTKIVYKRKRYWKMPCTTSFPSTATITARIGSSMLPLMCYAQNSMNFSSSWMGLAWNITSTKKP